MQGLTPEQRSKYARWLAAQRKKFANPFKDRGSDYAREMQRKGVEARKKRREDKEA